MHNLIKSDLYRSLKDKSLKVGLILFVVFSLIMIILYKALTDDLLNNYNAMDKTILTKVLTTVIFQLTADYGFVLPIILVTYMIKDFTYGTIRNKINSGYSKSKVYLSTLISSLIIGLALITVIWIFNLLFGIMLFGYTDLFTGKELAFIFGKYFFGILLYTVLISYVTFVLMHFRSVGISIALVIATPLMLALIFSILSSSSNSDFFEKVYTCTCYGGSTVLIGGAKEMVNSYVLSQQNAIIIIVSSIISTAIFAVGGALLHEKRDLK